MPSALDQPPRRRVITAPVLGLCLDYANTRFWRGSPVPTESLIDFDGWLRWLDRAGVADSDTVASLRVLREDDPGRAQQLFADSLLTRELLYRLFSTVAMGAACGAEAAALSKLIAAAPARDDLVLRGDVAGWRVPMSTPSVGEVLAPIVWSAADLALAVRRVRLRLCANEKCRWLFLDDSKAGTRRWCSMSSCGNRAKVHRHSLRSAVRGERAV